MKLTIDVLVEEHIEVHIIIYFAIWGAQISISFVTAGLINFFFCLRYSCNLFICTIPTLLDFTYSDNAAKNCQQQNNFLILI